MYVIHDKQFYTKKQAHNYVKKVIDSNFEKVISKGYVFNFFMSMVELHHNKEEKIGDGIISFYVGSDFYGRKALFINQVGGKRETISWVQICRFKAPTPEENFKVALRTSIEEQIRDFREKNEMVCELCGSDEFIQIDHIYLFRNLIVDFREKYDFEIPENYSKVKLTNQVCFKDEDEELENKWKKFHKENCKLRPLCRNCNLRRSRK